MNKITKWIKRIITKILFVGRWNPELTPDDKVHYRMRHQKLFNGAYKRREQLAQAVIAKKTFTIPQDMAIAKMEAGQVPEGEQIVKRALAIFEECKNSGKLERLVNKKPYLIRIPIPEEDLTIDSPFVRLAFHPDVLGPTCEYLGILPVIREIFLAYSPNDIPLEGLKDAATDYNSQYIHIDQLADTHMRVFLNISDVTENSGPFQVVPGTESDKILDHLGRSKFQNRLTDEQLVECGQQAFGAAPAVHKATGPAGTIWFADSCRCWHFGSREGTNPRLLYGIQYCHPFAPVLMPYPFQRFSQKLVGYPKLAHLAKQTNDPIEKGVLGASV